MIENDNNKEIQDAFDKVTKAVSDLEILIRKNYNTPKSNINRKDFNLIKIPSYYIRSKQTFVNEYKLYSIIRHNVHVSNIAYALQQSDFYNYLINRIYTYSAIEKLLLKAAIINIVSIYESLVCCTVIELHKFCKSPSNTICKYNSKCDYYVLSNNNNTKLRSFGNKVDYVFKKLELTDEVINSDNDTVCSAMKRLYDVRNLVHIHLSQEKDYYSTSYTLKDYNDSVRILLFLKENLATRINKFNVKRNSGCFSRPI